MMCDRRLFGPQEEAFAATHNVIIPELVEDSIEAMAHSVLNQVPPGPMNLAGLSMGGIVAMAVAESAPQRVMRLGLFDTNHLADAKERFAIRNRQIADVRGGRLREVIVEEMKPVYLAEVNRDKQDLLDLLVDMAMNCGPDTFIAQSIALRDREDRTAALAAYGGPALVLCGEEDLLCPLARHREIAQLLDDSTLVVIAGAGHISTLENPDAVNEAMRYWLYTPA